MTTHERWRRHQRRRVFLSSVACAVFSVSIGLSHNAWAGSYLNRASVLVRGARDEGAYLRARVYDVELAQMMQKIAEGRLRAAREMLVPKEVVLAHPHLLMMLEDYERAAAAAAEQKVDRFLELQSQARDEEQLLRTILRQLGWSLPDEH